MVVYLKQLDDILFSMQLGLVPHSFGIVNGRLECTFSRVISVLLGEENSDFNLDAPYYIIIGTGENPGNSV